MADVITHNIDQVVKRLTAFERVVCKGYKADHGEFGHDTPSVTCLAT